MAEQYYKIVNGEQVEITGDELTATKAEWQANNDAFPAVQLEQLRAARNGKLAACDWVVVKAQEDGTAVPTAWVTYRQALRDITATYSSIDDVVWPTKP
jgi:inorganic triphosphatase YgiF